MEKTIYKSAIIGPEDVVSGFKALGIRVFNASNGEEALDAFEKLKDGEEKFAVVMIVEDLLEVIDEVVYKEISREPLPAVVSLPGVKRGSGRSQANLKDLVIKAVGSDVLG